MSIASLYVTLVIALETSTMVLYPKRVLARNKHDCSPATSLLTFRVEIPRTIYCLICVAQISANAALTMH